MESGAAVVLWHPAGELGRAVVEAVAGGRPLLVIAGDPSVADAAAAAGALVAHRGEAETGALERAVERWGPPGAFVLLPAPPPSAPFQEVTPTVWRGVGAEIGDAALLLRAALPLAVAATSPRIVTLLPPDLPPARFQRPGRTAGAVLRAALDALVRELAAERRDADVTWLLAQLPGETAAAAALARRLALASDPAELSDARLE